MGSPEASRNLLEQASRLAAQHNLNDHLVVDADAHYADSLRAIAPYMDQPYRHRVEARLGQEFYILPYDLGDTRMGGRIKRDSLKLSAKGEVAAAAKTMGIDYSILYPTDIQYLGLTPQIGMEAAIAEGYARWLTDAVLPNEPTLRAMLYLPFGDPEASVRMIEKYGQHPGVSGFTVTSVRNLSVHDKRFAMIYDALNEQGLPLSFHTAPFWRDRQFEVFTRFLSVYALTPPFYNIIHLINLVYGGIPERYPKIKFIFCESGQGWLTFMRLRMDNEYRMRSSEAPILTKKPSEYIKDFYFTTQPLEQMPKMEHLKTIMDGVGSSQWLYASNYPQWDFDVPSRICELSFLSDEEKRNILGLNAARLFGLPTTNLQSKAL